MGAIQIGDDFQAVMGCDNGRRRVRVRRIADRETIAARQHRCLGLIERRVVADGKGVRGDDSGRDAVWPNIAGDDIVVEGA